METNNCLKECADTVANIYKWTKPTKPPFNVTWTPMNPHLRHEPKGVVLIIVPFNFPLFLTVSPLVRRFSIVQPTLWRDRAVNHSTTGEADVLTSFAFTH